MSNRFCEYELRKLKDDLEKRCTALSSIRRKEAQLRISERKAAVFQKTHGLCFYCGCDLGRKYHADHFIPISKGGSDKDDNLFPACQSCNSSKGTFTIEEWRHSLRVKLAREMTGMPAMSNGAISWLQENGFYILDGIPERGFWFENSEFSQTKGSINEDWSPSADSLIWAAAQEEKARIEAFYYFCQYYEVGADKLPRVFRELRALGLDPDILAQIQ